MDVVTGVSVPGTRDVPAAEDVSADAEPIAGLAFGAPAHAVQHRPVRTKGSIHTFVCQFCCSSLTEASCQCGIFFKKFNPQGDPSLWVRQSDEPFIIRDSLVRARQVEPC